MTGKTRKDRIRDETTGDNLRAALIANKMIGNISDGLATYKKYCNIQ